MLTGPTDRSVFRRCHRAVVSVFNNNSRLSKQSRCSVSICSPASARFQVRINLSVVVRERRRIDLSIGLTYATPREKLDAFVQGLKDLFERQPEADPEDCYIGLKDFGASSIDIEFWGFVRVYSYDDQIRLRHALIGDVVDLAEEIGVSFAFPTRTVHMLNAPPDFETPEGRRSDSATGAEGS
jgi:small-conductance mechanosensitive channel